ncbi:hypothetical protein BpHYR1_051043 [Brachionus plicatilis]|uniref:Uncharacterized protein n=1 Tax=Brachionus plicatilis TaxID=10195 RepID=A0A3M7SU43_BRAPC|nr:hypothetical protein BpHYR1_051043 [Brachionus plicatilis]
MIPFCHFNVTFFHRTYKITSRLPSAATTRTTLFVTLAPLDRIKRMWRHGVSKNVMFRFISFSLSLKAEMIWVIPPNSLWTIESSKVVLLWSTWRIMVTTGSLVPSHEGDGLSLLAIPS